MTSAARQQPARRAGSQLRYLTGARPSQLVQLADTRRTSRRTPLAGLRPLSAGGTEQAAVVIARPTAPLDPSCLIEKSSAAGAPNEPRGSSAVNPRGGRYQQILGVAHHVCGSLRLAVVGTNET